MADRNKSSRQHFVHEQRHEVAPGDDSVGFDFDAVDRALAEDDQRKSRRVNDTGTIITDDNDSRPTVEIDNTSTQRLYTQADLAHALHEFARWIILGTATNSAIRDRAYYISDTIAKRAIASAWVLDPQLFDGRSLSQIGRLPCIRFRRFSLAKHAREFSSVFHVASRGLKTQTARDAAKRAAVRRWAKVAGTIRIVVTADPTRN